jgi:hypothetical protein
MVNVSVGFGVHIDRKHAYTLYKILVLSDNYLLMLSAAERAVGRLDCINAISEPTGGENR